MDELYDTQRVLLIHNLVSKTTSSLWFLPEERNGQRCLHRKGNRIEKNIGHHTMDQ